jgi:Di- and tricarboxylate transporters
MPEYSMYITLGILFVSVFFFVQGKIRADIVGLSALILLMVSGILTSREGLSGFSSSIVIMMVGLLVVGGAIFRTGLAKMISSRILQLAGKNELVLFILIMVVTAFIGAFISNTGTVALMLPIVVSIASSANINVSRFLMPMAFASSLGIMTLISTPPNLTIHETLIGAGYEGLSFFSFLPIGLICLAIGMLVLIPLSKIFLSKKVSKNNTNKKGKSVTELTNEYQLENQMYRLKVLPNSKAIGKTVIDMEVRKLYSLNIIEIISLVKKRKNPERELLSQALILEGDILYTLGDFSHIQQYAEDFNLELMETESTDGSTEKLSFYQMGIAEVLILTNSAFLNKTVTESNIRENYNVNVVGFRRKDEYIINNIKDMRFHSGDIILVQGKWEAIGRLSEDQSQWVVLGQPWEEAAKVTLDHKAPIAAIVMLLMIVAMVFEFIPPVTAVLSAAVLMVLTGCFKNAEDAYKSINWESIVLIASMLPMSIALEKTGTASLIANGLVSGLGQFGPYALLAGVYLVTAIMTMFISNTATAVLLAPIALQAAQGLGESPYPFLFAVAVAASMCFASPFSTPPNALVMPVAHYKFMDYIKVGLPLQVIIAIVMILVLPLMFPFK